MKTYYTLILGGCLMTMPCAVATTSPTEPIKAQEEMKYYTFRGKGGFIFSRSKDLLQYLKVDKLDRDQGTHYLFKALRTGSIIHAGPVQALNIIAVRESSVGKVAKIKLRYNGMEITGYTMENSLKELYLDRIISMIEEDIEKDDGVSGDW